MDASTERYLQQIGESTADLQKKALREVKDEFHENQIQQAHELIEKTGRSVGNPWNKKENDDVQRAAKLVLGSEGGTHEEIDPNVAKEIDAVIEHRVRSAIRSGRIKPADMRDYNSYMHSLHEKSNRIRRGR